MLPPISRSLGPRRPTLGSSVSHSRPRSRPGSALGFLLRSLLLLGLLGVLGLSGLARFGTMRPLPVQPEPVVQPDPAGPQALPLLKRGDTLRVLSWNIQYLAGKGYVFFYDLPGNAGPDERPSSDSIARTLAEVVRVIREQNPHVVLLQEVDHGAARTDKSDQLALLLDSLPLFQAHTSTFYWKAAFVPHPRVLGAAGMKLSVLSRLRLGEATRIQLPQVPGPWLVRSFSIQRALQVVELPRDSGTPLQLVNVHLEAFVEGSPVMERQVATLDSLLESFNARHMPWIAAGDFNLLPPGHFEQVPSSERWLYNPKSEMSLLYNHHRVLPTQIQVDGPGWKRWFTQWPNRPDSRGPDKTIDYILLSPDLGLLDFQVLQEGTLRISDHLPLLVTVQGVP